MTRPYQETKEYEIVSELNELYREVGSIHKKLELLMSKISHMATAREEECRNMVREENEEILRNKCIAMEKEYKIREKVMKEGHIPGTPAFRNRFNEHEKKEYEEKLIATQKRIE
jgi:hypothetical protein